jgi:hypothetical protein
MEKDTTRESRLLAKIRTAIMTAGNKDVWAGRPEEISETIDAGIEAGISPAWKTHKLVWDQDKDALGTNALENLQKPWEMATALALASLRENRSILHKLAKRTRTFPSGDQMTSWTLACSIAVEIKNPKPLALLLEGMPSKWVERDKDTLKTACMFRGNEKVELLLKHGANPNAEWFSVEHQDWTPLVLLIANQGASWLPTASLLIKHGANTVVSDANLARIISSISECLDLEMAEWVRVNKIRSTRTAEPLSPTLLSHALRKHLEEDGKEKERAQEIVAGWPTETIRLTLERTPDVRKYPPGSPVSDPSGQALKILKEEMVVRKKLAVGQTRLQKKGPSLEF